MTDDLESWHGVFVEDSRVTTLYLPNNNLNGEVGEALGRAQAGGSHRRVAWMVGITAFSFDGSTRDR